MKVSKIIFITLAIFATYTLSAQVAITTDDSSTHPSAMLEVKSTDKGFLPPRMTTAQRNAIASPETGLVIYNTDANCLQWHNGTGWYDGCNGTLETLFVCGDNVTFLYNGSMVTYGTVQGQDGSCWMDRNLGASRVATSSADAAAFGDLFQWGRLSDGHQLRNSGTIASLSNGNVPGHGNFIMNPNSPYDWRSPQNDDLWQGVNGVNNPCPEGFRLPTAAEWEAERANWIGNNPAGAFASSLKLPAAGLRSYLDGFIYNEYVYGVYWSSTISGSLSQYLYFLPGNAGLNSFNRANAYSVRCIKD